MLYNNEFYFTYIKPSTFEQGLLEGIRLFQQRFQACKKAHQVLLNDRQSLQANHQNQRHKRRRNRYPDCVDCACESLQCSEISCDGLDCGGLDCGVLDCSGVDCCSFG